MRYYKAVIDSILGKLTIACSEEALIGLWIENQKYFCNNLPDNCIMDENHPIINKTKDWLDRYFKGLKPEAAELRLEPIGTKFQNDVWNILLKIPYGQAITYNDIAKILARNYGIEKMSAQAVGNAISHNPIFIIIPCHRVLSVNRSLSGYAGGLENKIKLLEFEKINYKH